MEWKTKIQLQSEVNLNNPALIYSVSDWS